MAWKIGELTRLPLGYVGENNSRTIEIDVSEWTKRFPDATIVVEAVRPDKYKYIAATECENDILTWTITAGDVNVEGKGIAQICAIDLNTYDVYKSRTVGTIIAESLEGFNVIELDDVDPSKVWVNRVLLASDTAIQSAEAAAEAAKLAVQSVNNAGYVFFRIEDGELYMYRSDGLNVSFTIEEGRLVMYE